MEVHVPQGEGAVLSDMVFGILRNFGSTDLNGDWRHGVLIMVLIDDRLIDSCVKSLQYFPMQNVSLNSVKDWLSCDIVRFKIEVGVDVKCTVKNTQNGHRSLQYRLQLLLQPVAICNAYGGRWHCTPCRHTRYCTL